MRRILPVLALLLLAPLLASGVIIKRRAPSAGAARFFFQWVLEDPATTLSGLTAPCDKLNAHLEGLAIFQCRAARRMRFDTTVYTIKDALSTSEKCTLRLQLNGFSQAWSVTDVGDGTTATCDASNLADADLDAVGESCARFGPGTMLEPGEPWAIAITDASGAFSCGSVDSIQIFVSGALL